MKKSACRPACALLPGNATGWGYTIPPTLVRVVVFANNCSDRSASLARKLGGGLSLDVRVVEAQLPPAVAHAGSARRAVMDLAEAWLVEAGENDGVILTTDADSQVAPNWIAENLAAFADGAEAVLGRIDLDEEGAPLPEALHRRGELEDRYERKSAHGIVLAARSPRPQSVAPPRYNLGRKPWRDPRSLLPRRASASRPPGRGQGADRLAVRAAMHEFAIARPST